MNKHVKPARVTKWLRWVAGPVVLVWQRMRSALASIELRRLWRSLSPTQREFTTNVLIATLTALAITLFHQNQWLVRVENSAMDLMMELNKGLPRMSDTESATPLQFALLDVDDESFRSWGEPFHTPRNKLQVLVDYAASSGARLTVVDFDLSRSGIEPDHDESLVQYLAAYGDSSMVPPLILVRNFYSAENLGNGWDEIRPSFLDNVALPENVYWAQPLFRATLGDGIVRHWHLVKTGCLNGRMQLLPAVQLVAAGLLGEVEPNLATSMVAPGAVGLAGCKSIGEPGASGVDATLDQRIIYTMGWRTASPDLVTIPAHLVADAEQPLAADLVRDRVVIIGASHVDSGDIHRTPIGAMPGALIIANSIKSLALYGQIERPPMWLQWLAKLATILFAAWVFLSFRSLLGVFVAGTVILIVLTPISFFFFKYGLWVDFALPLFAMVVHRAVAEYRGAQREAIAMSAKFGRVEDES